MKLFIDTSNNKRIIVQLAKERIVQPIKVGEGEKLLSLIDKIVKKNKTSIEKIDEIEVVLGPGSFTGLRIGVSVANALGWALKIPINKKKIGELVEPKY